MLRTLCSLLLIFQAVPTTTEPRTYQADRLRLQGRAPANLRRHLWRAARRIGVLVSADLLAFVLMRTAVQAIRDHALLGGWVAGRAGTIMARGSLNAHGILNGWQYAAALLLGLLVTGSYGVGDRRRDPRRLFLAAALATALPLWSTIWSRGLGVVLAQYAVTTGSAWVLLVLERHVVDRLFAHLPEASRGGARTLLVGAEADCRTVMSGPVFAAGGDYRLLGFLDVTTPPGPEALGDLDDLPRVLHESRVDTVLICGQPDMKALHEVVGAALAAGCHLLAQPPVLEVTGVQPALVWRHEQPFIDLTVPSLTGWRLIVKRAVDVLGSLAAIALLSPAFLVIAAWIKADSPGPVFFRQERIGSGGRRFRVWKFRTMRYGASDAAHRELIHQLIRGEEDDAQPGPEGERVYKLTNDDRVTRVGRFLRRTSLDELPQLFNVLRGEMSLVGPRPPLAYELDIYDRWQFDRLEVRPGMTGLWQVSGRSRLSYRRMCELDVEYVRNWSLWLDLKILLKTIPVVLFNSGKAA